MTGISKNALYLTTLLILGLIVLLIPRTSAQSQTKFDPLKDPYAAGFGYLRGMDATALDGRSLGRIAQLSKYQPAIKTLSQTVFIPDAHEFDYSDDTIQLLVKNLDGIVQGGYGDWSIVAGTHGSGTPGNDKSCTIVPGGRECTVVWDIQEFELRNGPIDPDEYSTQLQIHSSTRLSFGNEAGLVWGENNAALGAEKLPASSSLTFGEFVSRPMVQFQYSQDSYSLTDREEPLSFDVIVNMVDKPDRAVLVVDGVIVEESTDFIEQEVTYKNDLNIPAIISFDLDSDYLQGLSNGAHTIEVYTESPSYVQYARTQSGQEFINLSIAYEEIDPACREQKLALAGVMTKVVGQKSRQAETIETIDNKVQEFFEQNPNQLSIYADLVNANDVANKDVYSAITELVGSSRLDCSKDFNDQIDEFSQNVNDVYLRLIDYRTSVINLIDEIKNASMEE